MMREHIRTLRQGGTVRIGHLRIRTFEHDPRLWGVEFGPIDTRVGLGFILVIWRR